MREAADVTIEEAAAALGAYRTKIHRIERGEWKRLREGDLRTLASLYGVDSEHAEALVAMAKQASTKGWWGTYSDVLGPGSYVSLETQASSLRFYSGLLVPGLFQTRRYAEAIMRIGRISSETEIERRLEARLTRQSILEREDSPNIEVIIDQAALNKTVGSAFVMAEQLLHLAEIATNERVELGVLPDSAGAHTAMTGQFVILDFPGNHDDSAIFIDNAHNGIFLEDNEEVGDYNEVFTKAQERCWTGADARDFVSNLASSFLEQSRQHPEDS